MSSLLNCKKSLSIGDREVIKKGGKVFLEPSVVYWFEDEIYIPREEEDFHIPRQHKVTSNCYTMDRTGFVLRFYSDKETANHFGGLYLNDYFERSTLELTQENVAMVQKDCYGDPSNLGTITIQGIENTYAYDKQKLEEHEKDITDMLSQLPDTFFKSKGGGWSFLNMCVRKDTYQWTGLHLMVEYLMCLGIASGKIESLVPRDMWKILPGGMPYVAIKD